VRPAARRRLRLSYLTVRTMADAAKPTNMLSTKGQVIPPAATRRRHNWRPGTRLAVEDTADGVLFTGAHDIFPAASASSSCTNRTAMIRRNCSKVFVGSSVAISWASNPMHAVALSTPSSMLPSVHEVSLDFEPQSISLRLRTCRCRPRRDCCRAMQWRRAQAPAYADCRGSVRTAYLIATALVHGRVGITEVADIDNAPLLTIAAQMEGIGAGQETDGITIRLLDGRTATVRIGSPLGSPENRLSIG